MQTIIYIVGFFILGYIARRFTTRPTHVAAWLNSYIIYVAMPSIILLKIPALEFNPSMLIPAGFAWLWALIGGCMIIALCRFFRIAKPLEGAALLLTILGNTSFLGYPMVQAFFNDTVLSYAIFYDQLGSFLILSTAGIITIAVYAPNGSEQAINATRIAKRVMSFPPFLALLIASFMPIEDLIIDLQPLLKLFSATLMPIALLVIGLQFQPQLLPEHRLPLLSAISLKMIMAPLLAYLALTATSAATPITQATVFEAAMPCMITPGIMAIQAGLSPRFCATLIGYSTLFSFLWLPLIAVLIG